MCAPKAPTPPDPVATVNAQSQANTQNLTQNAELNRINQYGPTGSLTYQISGYNPDGTPQYTQNTQLSPGVQNLYDLSLQGGTGLLNTAIGMEGQVGNSYANPIDTSGAPGLTSSVSASPVDFNAPQRGNVQSQFNPTGIPFALSAGNAGPIANHIAQPGVGIASQVNGGQSWHDAVKQAQDAAYRGQSQYLDPQFEQGKEALDNQLANQGIVQGSEAYNNAEGNFARQKQAAYQSAQDSAVQAGNQEQNVLYGQGLSSAELQNAARGQVFGENTAQQQAYNAAQAQRFGQGATNAGILNAANQQAFGQSAASGQFANSAEAQNFSEQQAQQEAINAAQQQQYGQSLQSGQFQNQAQQQYLQQLFALRNQPLNEFSALMSGGQVQAPNLPFSTQYAQPTVGPVNAAGIMQNNFQNQMGVYGQKMAGINNLFSLGGSLGSAAILA